MSPARPTPPSLDDKGPNASPFFFHSRLFTRARSNNCSACKELNIPACDSPTSKCQHQCCNMHSQCTGFERIVGRSTPGSNRAGTETASRRYEVAAMLFSEYRDPGVHFALLTYHLDRVPSSSSIMTFEAAWVASLAALLTVELDSAFSSDFSPCVPEETGA